MTTLSQNMNAKSFLSLIKHNKNSIKAVHFIAPKLGSHSFGYFKVIFNYGRSTRQR